MAKRALENTKNVRWYNSIRTKVLFIAIVPLVFALFVSAKMIWSSYTTNDEMKGLDELMVLASHASEYAHETQRESGLTSIYVSSGGALLGDELANQRKKTNKKRDELNKLLGAFGQHKHDELFEDLITSVSSELLKLDSVRNEVDTLSVTALETVSLYHAQDVIVIAIVSEAMRHSKNAEFLTASLRYTSFLQLKELASQERATLSAIFAVDQIDGVSFKQFSAYVVEQDSYLSTFLDLATNEEVKVYNSNLTSEVIEGVDRVRDIVFDETRTLPTDLVWAARFNTIQVQQWLTDISATRGLDGLDGGFDLAKNFALDFQNNIALLRKIVTDSDKALDEIVRSFDTFYEKGKWMAQLYIDEGVGAGNAAMAEFDAAAHDINDRLIAFGNSMELRAGFGIDTFDWHSAITAKIDLLRTVELKVEGHVVDVVDKMQLQAKKTLLIMSFWALTVTLVVLVSVVAVSQRLIKPISQLVEFLHIVTTGDYSQRITTIGNDETGVLASSVNAMVESLDKTFALMVEQRDQLSQSNQDLQEQQKELELMAQAHEILVQLAEDASKVAKAADQVKSDFLANMSHEIRTPMTAILGFAETLAENVTDPENIEAVTIIEKNGRHLLAVINDILDLSKLDADKIAIELMPVNPVELTAEVVSLIKHKAEAKKLSLDIKYLGDIPEIIQTDPTRLRQILINLLGNAIKFTEHGGITLEIQYDANTKTPVLHIDVKDTGIGMTQDQMLGLFKPFVQADNSTTRKFGGTGLGLTISKRFAELLGGDITIPSSVGGEGTTFRATIAIGSMDGVKMISDPVAAVSESSKPQVKTQLVDLAGIRILLAEDGPDNQKLISFVLKKAGAQVVIAENGKVALDTALEAKASGNPFHCILMDMQMPIMSGYDSTAELREANYTGPIIALTAHAMAGDREKCINAGCDDFANKPINRKELIAMIADHARPSSQAA